MRRRSLQDIRDEVMKELHLLDKVVDNPNNHHPDIVLQAEGALRECHFFMDLLGYDVIPERWNKV
jgi:hypothetical protein